MGRKIIKVATNDDFGICRDLRGEIRGGKRTNREDMRSISKWLESKKRNFKADNDSAFIVDANHQPEAEIKERTTNNSENRRQFLRA